jgi:hypothetical protein
MDAAPGRARRPDCGGDGGRKAAGRPTCACEGVRLRYPAPSSHPRLRFCPVSAQPLGIRNYRTPQTSDGTPPPPSSRGAGPAAFARMRWPNRRRAGSLRMTSRRAGRRWAGRSVPVPEGRHNAHRGYTRKDSRPEHGRGSPTRTACLAFRRAGAPRRRAKPRCRATDWPGGTGRPACRAQIPGLSAPIGGGCRTGKATGVLESRARTLCPPRAASAPAPWGRAAPHRARCAAHPRAGPDSRQWRFESDGSIRVRALANHPRCRRRAVIVCS